MKSLIQKVEVNMKVERTTAAQSWTLSFNLTGIVSRIHLDPDGGHGNGLRNRSHMLADGLRILNPGGPGLTWSANRTMMV